MDECQECKNSTLPENITLTIKPSGWTPTDEEECQVCAENALVMVSVNHHLTGKVQYNVKAPTYDQCRDMLAVVGVIIPKHLPR